MRNVPDDWGTFNTKCSYCGARYHMSEGGCGCLDEGKCVGCGADCGRKEFDEHREEFICEDCTPCAQCNEITVKEGMVDVYGDFYCVYCHKETVDD